MFRLGLIGHGRIGRRIAARLAEKGPAPVLAAVLTRPGGEGERALPPGAAVADLDAFLAREPDLVVECASAGALRACGPAVLASGADLLPLSLAALADPVFETVLLEAARRGPGRLEIPAGAVGGLDMIAAAREDDLKAVTFRAIYPAPRWRGTPAERLVDLGAVSGRTVFFSGTVREIARDYPHHVNVSVGVALAGLGLDATRAELAADPDLTQAVFEVEVEAGPGPLRLVVSGRDAPLGADPIDYTTFSVLRLIRRRLARILI